MKIIGIDIGYYNLGLVLAECIDANVNVLYVQKVDLTDFKTRETPELSDMIQEFVMTYADIFSQADQILIERQPPGGISSVEVLLHYIFRHKAVLISPVSMHSHFNIGHLDYEQRKLRTESIASKYIKDSVYYEKLDRKHDIADALCMILFQNYKNGIQFKRTTIAQSGLFEEFAFSAPVNI
jgi:hypothetical protein